MGCVRTFSNISIRQPLHIVDVGFGIMFEHRAKKLVKQLDVDINNSIVLLKKKPQTHRLYIFSALEDTLRLFA